MAVSRGQRLFQMRVRCISLPGTHLAFKRGSSSLDADLINALEKTQPQAAAVPVNRRGQMEASPASKHDADKNGISNCPNSCLCSNKIEIDYKNVRLLSQFVSSHTGLIIPNTITRVCDAKQRKIAKAIKRARSMGFMPYINKLPQYLRDPKLF